MIVPVPRPTVKRNGLDVSDVPRRAPASLAAMPSSEYHEALWEVVPEGGEPPQLALRLAFLLGRTAPGERVLDVGCDEGASAPSCSPPGAGPW